MDLFEITGAFGIVTSILSFSNNATLSSICRYAMYVFWGAYVLMVILKGNFKFRPIIWYMLAVYGIMFAVGRFFYSEGIYQSYGPGPAMYLPYCAFFYFAGYNCQNDCKREANIYIKAYLYAHIVFVILKLLFLRGESADSTGKNQSAQIIGMGIVLALYALPLFEQRKWIKRGFFLFALLSFGVLIQMHSRTPALAVLLTTAYWFFTQKAKKRNYIFAALLIVISVIYFNTEGGSDFLFDYLRGDYRGDELSWSVVSSGRTDLYAEVFQEILQHPFIGQGAWAYLDNFPIHVLRTGGLMAAFLILPIAYGRIFRFVRRDFLQRRKAEDESRDVLLRTAGLICVYYFVISLFEGYPPLGPGVSTFILWIMIGLTDRHHFENMEAAELLRNESYV